MVHNLQFVSTGLWLEMQASHTHPGSSLSSYLSPHSRCLFLPFTFLSLTPQACLCGLMWSVWDDQAGQWDNEARKYWSGLTGWAVHLLPPGNVSDINDEHGNNRERKAYILQTSILFWQSNTTTSQICKSVGRGPLCARVVFSASKINFAHSQCCYKNALSWAHVWPPGLTAWRCSIWRT